MTSDPGAVAPDGPHEVLASLAAEVREASKPPSRSVAKWLAVLAVAVVLSSVLSFLAILQTQSTLHQMQMQRRVARAAQLKVNAKLADEQAAIPSQVDARLCALVKALTPPSKLNDPDTVALKKQIHCQ